MTSSLGKDAMRRTWEDSFEEQVRSGAYNTAPVEALVRNVSYHLRAQFPSGVPPGLSFLEMGCGAGPNLVWLAEKGLTVSGVDIAPTALALAHERLRRGGHEALTGNLLEGSVTDVPLPDASFDGILESCVFQHLAREDRARAFAEVRRLLKPGGVFAGYLLSDAHTIYQDKRHRELADDPGTLVLEEGGSKLYLSNIGLAHFFRREEFAGLLHGFRVVDPCAATYELPLEEAKRRGYGRYLQGMWAVYAVK